MIPHDDPVESFHLKKNFFEQRTWSRDNPLWNEKLTEIDPIMNWSQETMRPWWTMVWKVPWAWTAGRLFDIQTHILPRVRTWPNGMYNTRRYNACNEMCFARWHHLGADSVRHTALYGCDIPRELRNSRSVLVYRCCSNLSPVHGHPHDFTRRPDKFRTGNSTAIFTILRVIFLTYFHLFAIFFTKTSSSFSHLISSYYVLTLFHWLRNWHVLDEFTF